MDNQDINIWLLKRIQTEGSLRSEERRLDAAKSEYNSERCKYQNAKETFQSTRLRLLNEKEPGAHPQAALEYAKSESFKLKDNKLQLDILNDRLTTIEGKVKRQTVLVLQNKKKLEVLEDRINILQGRKAAKKNFKEELEILDSRIQQIVLNNRKTKDFKVNETDSSGSEVRDRDDLLSSDDRSAVQSLEPVSVPLISDPQSLSADSLAGGMSQQSRQQANDQCLNQFNQPQNQPEQRNNREFYEQIQNLTFLRDDEVDQLNLCYYNKSGNIFELQIKKQNDQGYIIEIKPHSKLDALSLKNGKSEIIESLKLQGLKLNRITVREVSHAE